MNKELVVSQMHIENRIFTIRGVQVMLDSDLAEMYQTEPKFVNRAMKRNPDRFPETFAFQLTAKEWENLRFQSGTSSENKSLRFQSGTLNAGRGQHRKYLPFAFTEQGIAMLSAVKQFTPSHDRFLIIDKGEAVYHIGASLKDLGKRWFAFSKMNKDSVVSIVSAVAELM